MTDMDRDGDAGAPRAAQDRVLGFDDGGEFAFGIDACLTHLIDPVTKHEAVSLPEADPGRTGLGRLSLEGIQVRTESTTVP